jgi:hypothetical protein
VKRGTTPRVLGALFNPTQVRYGVVFGRAQCLYIAQWRLTEEPAVLGVELGRAFVAYLEGRAARIHLRQHEPSRFMQPDLLLVLNPPIWKDRQNASAASPDSFRPRN